MTAHEAIAAWPVTGNADKALARALATRRLPYSLSSVESAADLVVVDPATGVVPLYIVQNGTLFEYDSLDSTTVASAVCLVTSDGKRYKSGGITPPYSVLTVGTTAQPATPAIGNTYLIPTAATGADWAGQDGKIGIYSRAGWQFVINPIGRSLYAEDTNIRWYRNAAGTWVSGFGAVTLGAGSVLPSMQSGLGARERWLVENQTTDAQPAASNGVAYIIGPTPTGAIWAGNAGKIAHGEGGTWVVYTPTAGWLAYDKALARDVRYSGTAWVSSAGSIVGFNSIGPASAAFSGGIVGDATEYVYSATVFPGAQNKVFDDTPLPYVSKTIGNKLRLHYHFEMPTFSTSASAAAANLEVGLALYRDSETAALGYVTFAAAVVDVPRFIDAHFLIAASDAGTSHDYKFAMMTLTDGSTRRAWTAASRRVMTIEEIVT